MTLVLSSGCARVGFGGAAGDATAGDQALADALDDSTTGDALDDSTTGDALDDSTTVTVDSRSRLDGPSSLGDGGVGTLLLIDETHDTCRSALETDLEPRSIGLLVDTQRATDNYGDSCCAGHPDLVLRLEHIPAAPTQVMVSCTGGGDLMLRVPERSGETCPPDIDGACRTLSCEGAVAQTLGALDEESTILVCRDPSLQPAELTLSR